MNVRMNECIYVHMYVRMYVRIEPEELKKTILNQSAFR